MKLAVIFARWILRPLAAEKARTLLTVFAVSLGVAVIVAIDLAGDAAAGSFRSSMETLAGEAQLEITAVGGVDEQLLGDLVRIPEPFEFSPRIEGFAVVERTGATVPLIGLDLLTLGDREVRGEPGDLRDWNAVWVSEPLARDGDSIRLTVNDKSEEYAVRGTVPGSDGFIVMDIGAAQQAMGRLGRVDRIEVRLPPEFALEQARSVLRGVLPEGVEVRAYGAATAGNRRMLEAFRWNLRVLSYISLVVGAFLIYNAIAVSVVRRRAEIGILRALGATRAQVVLLFLMEALAFGFFGTVAGIALGRLLAEGAVGLLATTVQSLYVSSTPGAIEITPGVVIAAVASGMGIVLAAALAPAREAATVPPVEAMARGQREFHARVRIWRNLAASVAAASIAYLLARMEPWDGKPVGGYAACFVLILASALAIPACVSAASRLLARVAAKMFGVEGLLAARGVSSSLSRTSVLVGALSTAVAMMVSVGLLVGSFRETVTVWMGNQLQADFYIRPAGGSGAGRHPTIAVGVAERIEALDEVAAVDRFRAYEITIDGMPALLGGGEASVIARYGRTSFLPGSDRRAILEKLPSGDFCIVSEPFANKHDVGAGDRVRVPLGNRLVSFEVLGVYYDYSNERGYVIVDRSTLLRYLPDPAPANLAVYLRPGMQLEHARREIERVTAGNRLVVTDNQNLRTQALAVFDRTFAVTWALEGIAILVAVLGVTGALINLVIDRRREFGLLRFLGAAPAQVRRLILCEAGLLGVLSNAVGFGLGYGLSLVLIYVINRQSFGWTIQFHWPVALLVAALTLIYVATIAAAWYPARMAARLVPIEVIHEE